MALAERCLGARSRPTFHDRRLGCHVPRFPACSLVIYPVGLGTSVRAGATQIARVQLSLDLITHFANPRASTCPSPFLPIQPTVGRLLHEPSGQSPRQHWISPETLRTTPRLPAADLAGPGQPSAAAPTPRLALRSSLGKLFVIRAIRLCTTVPRALRLEGRRGGCTSYRSLRSVKR